MRFLSTTNRLTLVTLQNRQGAVSFFVVPPELAAMLTWFLGSWLLRLIALVTYCFLCRLVGQCRVIYIYLAAVPGRALRQAQGRLRQAQDAVKEAVLDFFLGGLVYAT